MSAQHFISVRVDRFVFSPPVLTLPAVCLFVQVARHLTKLFDSLAKLKFVMGSDGKEQKMASGMYSKDGEYVDMDSQCDLSGQVCRGGATLISFIFFRVICGLCVFCGLCISVVIVFVVLLLLFGGFIFITFWREDAVLQGAYHACENFAEVRKIDELKTKCQIVCYNTQSLML